MARPKKDDYHKKDKRLMVHVTDTVYTAFTARCNRKHKTISSELEEILLQTMQTDPIFVALTNAHDRPVEEFYDAENYSMDQNGDCIDDEW